jgi:hypothetical protein
LAEKLKRFERCKNAIGCMVNNEERTFFVEDGYIANKGSEVCSLFFGVALLLDFTNHSPESFPGYHFASQDKLLCAGGKSFFMDAWQGRRSERGVSAGPVKWPGAKSF